MAQVTGAFPYDIDNLLGGAVRVLYAPKSVPKPTSIADVINMVSPYAPKTGWLDLGATRDGFSYSRSFDVEGYEIQQTPSPVLEEITDITRTVTASAAEFTPELLKIMEESSGNPGLVAATANASAQDTVKFGSFSTTSSYRIAFISRRHKNSGLVVEPTAGYDRGRFVMGVGYSVNLTADEVEIEGEKGTLSAFGLSFRMFPEAGEVYGHEHGMWFFEKAGTISAT